MDTGRGLLDHARLGKRASSSDRRRIRSRGLSVRLAVVGVLIAAVSPIPAQASSDGTLDITFDLDGKLTTAIGSSDDSAESIAIQPNGKIVAGGYSFNGRPSKSHSKAGSRGGARNIEPSRGPATPSSAGSRSFCGHRRQDPLDPRPTLR